MSKLLDITKEYADERMHVRVFPSIHTCECVAVSLGNGTVHVTMTTEELGCEHTMRARAKNAIRMLKQCEDGDNEEG